MLNKTKKNRNKRRFSHRKHYIADVAVVSRERESPPTPPVPPTKERGHRYDYSDPLNYTDEYLYEGLYYYGNMCISCVYWDGRRCGADRGFCEYKAF